MPQGQSPDCLQNTARPIEVWRGFSRGRLTRVVVINSDCFIEQVTATDRMGDPRWNDVFDYKSVIQALTAFALYEGENNNGVVWSGKCSGFDAQVVVEGNYCHINRQQGTGYCVGFDVSPDLDYVNLQIAQECLTSFAVSLGKEASEGRLRLR
ncbi:hypothetical protein BH10CYA1_BH10CYA1_53750 [soil metagenome]